MKINDFKWDGVDHKYKDMDFRILLDYRRIDLDALYEEINPIIPLTVFFEYEEKPVHVLVNAITTEYMYASDRKALLDNLCRNAYKEYERSLTTQQG